MSKPKKEDGVFVASKATKHFKMDKATKRLMALSKFPAAPKPTVQECAALKQEKGIVLEPLTKSDFKSLFITGQLAQTDARLSGLRDPLWKPKKNKEEAEDSDAAGVASGSKRKGKKAPKMRAAPQESATTVEQQQNS